MAFEAFRHEGLHPDTLIAAAGWTILLSVVLHGVSAQPLADWYARRLAGMPPDTPELRDTQDMPMRRARLHAASGNSPEASKRMMRRNMR